MNYSEILDKLQSLGYVVTAFSGSKDDYRLLYKLNQKKPNKSDVWHFIHSINGNAYILKKSFKSNFKLSFNGLTQYDTAKMKLTDTALFMQDDLRLITSSIPHRLIGIDLCVDSPKPIKPKQNNRTSYLVGDTLYLNSQRAQNDNYVNFRVYNKQKKNKLDYACYRAEISFKRAYFNKPKSYQDMAKAFAKYLNFKVKIEPLINCAEF